MLSRISYISLGVGAAIFLITYLVFWLPFFVAGAAGQLFLYPLLIIILPMIGIACVLSIVFAGLALSDRRRTLSSSRAARPLITTIVLAAVLFLGAGPIIWFGSILAGLWGGDMSIVPEHLRVG